jgi:H+/gluconate symporter-like permease
MGLKVFFRTVFFLLTLFVVIYTAMKNPQEIMFNFPLLLKEPVKAAAPIIFFAIFAVGVFGGTLLNSCGGKGKGGGDSSKKK